MAWSTPSSVSTGDLITAATWNQDVVDNTVALLPSAIEFFIDGGGAAISTGIKGVIEVPMKCDIDRGTLLADQVGDIVIDVWKTTYANYIPADSDSITASAPLTISCADQAQDDSLTGWTKAIAAGDALMYNVDSCAIITWCLVSLKVSRS